MQIIFKVAKRTWNFFSESEIKEIPDFYESELDKLTQRGDYRELIGLSLLRFSEKTGKKLKIRPPEAKHQAG